MRNENLKNQEQPQEPERRRVYLAVWEVNQHQNLPSSRDAEWPEFRNDRERIKYNTQHYKDTPISEAMCGVKHEDVSIPAIPQQPIIGNIYKARMTKHGDHVTFDGISLKESFICRNNLRKYTHLECTDKEVDVKIVAYDKAHQTVTIDVLQPIFDKWINGIISDKSVQYNTKSPKTIEVSELKLRNGGFVGKAEVKVLSEFVGEPYYVDAFIPGSQIVLNIENDFERWEGATVETFVVSYTVKPGSVNQMSLICSRKAYLNFLGNMTKIKMYNEYCGESKTWETFTHSTFSGIVTGVINSSKKCGVFVELPMFNITGMINVDADKLVYFKAGDGVKVRITDFEQMLQYDNITGKNVHLIPYVIENDCLKSCILKPVFELA